MESLVEKRNFPIFIKANFSKRLFAFVLDLIIISSLYRLLGIGFKVFKIERSLAFISVYNLARLAVYLLYFFITTLILKGQTIGKAILGIEVVSLYDEKLSLSSIFYREIVGRFVQKKLMFLYLMPIFTEEKQALSDIVAGTVVVDKKNVLDFKEALEIRDNLLNYNCKQEEVNI